VLWNQADDIIYNRIKTGVNPSYVFLQKSELLDKNDFPGNSLKFSNVKSHKNI
jgi:hypothetical protein